MYADDGWDGMGDWLGTGRRRVTGWRTFTKACAFVHGLGLKSQREWFDYCKSGKKPADIPANPSSVYAKGGWSGWADWLGTGRQRVALQPFKKARAYARRLALKSQAEWVGYCKSGKKPIDIPASPEHVYAKTGWVGWSDWLGTDK
jgi:hypothetical protein